MAVEDNKSETKSAVAAGIPTVGYVGSYNRDAKQKEMEQALEDLGVKKVMYHWSEFLKCLAKIEAL